MTKIKPPLKLPIKGTEWVFYAQIPRTYKRQHDTDGKESSGVTYLHEREVYLCLSEIRPWLVKHELMHIFVHLRNIRSARLDADQIEELCCDIYGEDGAEMDFLSEKIIHYFLD